MKMKSIKGVSGIKGPRWKVKRLKDCIGAKSQT
jgi:hypothetical protein